MVSLDNAVVARLEKGGKRYEILVDPELVDQFKSDPSSVSLDDLLATDEVWHDAKGGERPTEEKILSTFGTTELLDCVINILSKGSIQLTTLQRRQMIADKRQQIITEISRTAIDPRSKAPHPATESNWHLMNYVGIPTRSSRWSVKSRMQLLYSVQSSHFRLKQLNSLSVFPAPHMVPSKERYVAMSSRKNGCPMGTGPSLSKSPQA